LGRRVGALIAACAALAAPVRAGMAQVSGRPPASGGRPPASAAADADARYARHVDKLKLAAAKLRGRFSFVVEPPFVVAGDAGRADVRRHAEGLIRWSVGELKKHYFAKDPAQIVTIWLFRDRASYLVNSTRLSGEPPGTPFGYYSPRLAALIMNISTGGGTLVHEIVHPFMEANVPDCPPWLNEGLGSLYEGVGRRNHEIWGYLNWRLPGLQRAIRARRVPGFAELLAQGERGFYGRDPGTNYAQARYLLYYLQDRGLLRTFFKRYLASRATDATGVATLKAVLGEEDLERFHRRWQRWVLALKYTNPPTR
jgi:hypothetical protein